MENERQSARKNLGGLQFHGGAFLWKGGRGTTHSTCDCSGRLLTVGAAESVNNPKADVFKCGVSEVLDKREWSF